VSNLETSGYEVVLLRPEEATVEILTSRPFNLLLLDVNSADSPAYRLCEQSRTVVDIPVMLILRGIARTDVLRGYQAGADAYLLFPFDDRELEARLNGLLRRHPASRSLV
jgi:DNA-binding response OmpR family regulator